MLEEFWAAADKTSVDLGNRLALWVHHYNWDRPHEALHGLMPIDPVCQLVDKTPLGDEVSAV